MGVATVAPANRIMPNLNTTKTAELRKLAKKAKIENWETLERKGLLKALAPKEEEVKEEEVKEEVKEEETESEETEEVEEDKVVAPGVEEKHVAVGSKAERMKAKLAKQPKVRILIQSVQGEKRGSTMSIILNGYRLNIQKGVYVDVPQQVADVIMKSQKQTIMALDHSLKIDGGKPELNA